MFNVDDRTYLLWLFYIQFTNDPVEFLVVEPIAVEFLLREAGSMYGFSDSNSWTKSYCTLLFFRPDSPAFWLEFRRWIRGRWTEASLAVSLHVGIVDIVRKVARDNNFAEHFGSSILRSELIVILEQIGRRKYSCGFGWADQSGTDFFFMNLICCVFCVCFSLWGRFRVRSVFQTWLVLLLRITLERQNNY